MTKRKAGGKQYSFSTKVTFTQMSKRSLSSSQSNRRGTYKQVLTTRPWGQPVWGTPTCRAWTSAVCIHTAHLIIPICGWGNLWNSNCKLCLQLQASHDLITSSPHSSNIFGCLPQSSFPTSHITFVFSFPQLINSSKWPEKETVGFMVGHYGYNTATWYAKVFKFANC